MSNINIDEIMKEVKTRAARRQSDQQSMQAKHPDEHSPDGQPFMELIPVEFPQHLHAPHLNTDKVLEFRDAYSLADFLSFHDGLFIRNAYRGILGREPDAHGYAHYLTKLRNGDFNKIEILGRLRYSTEGRYLAKPVRGLFIPFVFTIICKIPVAGYAVRLGAGILQLPRIINNIYRYEAFTQGQLNEIKKNAADVQKELAVFLNTAANTINNLIEVVTRNKANKSAIDQVRNELSAWLKGKADQAELLHVKQQIDHLSINKADKETLHYIQQQLAEIRTISNELKEIHQKMQWAMQHLMDFQQKMLAQEHEFAEVVEELEDALVEEELIRGASYLAFEDTFRGTREEVKKKHGIYLPYLEKLSAEIKSMPMLDVGCGRGEWLELLKEHNYRAIGVDINNNMIQQCCALGLTAVADDALNYIKKLDSQSIGVITGFHVIEHLSFRNRMKLFDEALRVLASGGMAIFETPNPENLMVGACEFYSDPTHKRPVPPATLQYFMQSRGFQNTHILRLNKDEQLLPDNHAFEKLLAVEKDYAVIGYKV